MLELDDPTTEAIDPQPAECGVHWHAPLVTILTLRTATRVWTGWLENVCGCCVGLMIRAIVVSNGERSSRPEP